MRGIASRSRLRAKPDDSGSRAGFAAGLVVAGVRVRRLHVSGVLLLGTSGTGLTFLAFVLLLVSCVAEVSTTTPAVKS